MKHIGLRAKLALGFGTLLVLLVLTGLVGYYSTSRVIAAAEGAGFSMKRKELATEVELAVRNQARSGFYYVFIGDPSSLGQYEQNKREAAQRLDELSTMITAEKGKTLVTKLRESTERMSAVDEQAIELKEQKRSREASDIVAGTKVQSAMNRVVADCAELETWEDKLTQDDLKAEHQTESQADRLTLFLVACGLLIGITIAVLIGRSITGSLKNMLGMIQKVSAKDLTAEDVGVGADDEVGHAELALNSMKNTLHDLVRSIARTAERLASASEQISVSANRSVETARIQADQTQQVAVSMQQMATAVLQVSEHSQKASDSSYQAAQAARQGGEVVEQTLETMRKIADSSKTVSARITALGSSSEQIGKIVAVIDDLADQTNLLALNAAIEAARAGEQGRGFAVVADEVRKLAERTTQATHGIGTMVQSIQVETRNAVQAIEVGSRDVEVGVQKTTASGAALKEIIQMSEQVGDMITQIATAAAEQSSTTSEVNTNVSQISSLTQGSSVSAEETATACREVSKMALELRNLVNQFKLTGSSDSIENSKLELGAHAIVPPGKSALQGLSQSKAKAAAASN
jgi:methyl-accepting chemotaxis protein